MIESGPAVAWAQSRSKTNLAAAMNRTMMKIRATDRVLSFASPHREPRYAPTNTIGMRIGIRK